MSALDVEPGHGEPTPWATGLTVGTFCALFGALLLVGLYSLIAAMIPQPTLARWVGVAAALFVAGGLGWTLWAMRDRPVWRWIVWGALIGFLAGVGSSVALLALGR
ncbi:MULTISPECIES: DUF2537 domain-containing protein [unclassified Gordonia (in: high G+C Gram-positive bacteria)]